MIEPQNRPEYSLEREAREVLYQVLGEKQRIIRQLSTQLVDFTSQLSSVAVKCERMQKMAEKMEGNLAIDDLVEGGFVNQQDGISYVLVDLSQLIRQKVANVKIDPKAKIIKQIGRAEEKPNTEIENLYSNIKAHYENVTKQMLDKLSQNQAVIQSLKNQIKSNQEGYEAKIAALEQQIQILQDSNQMFEVEMQQLKKQKNDWRCEANKREKDKTTESVESTNLQQLQQLRKKIELLQKQILFKDRQNNELWIKNGSLQKGMELLEQSKYKYQKQCEILKKQVDNIRRISFEQQSKVMQFFPGNKLISENPHNCNFIGDDKISLQDKNIELQHCLQKVKSENSQLFNQNFRLKQQRKVQEALSIGVKHTESNQQLSQTALFMADLMQKIKNLSNKNDLLLRCNEPEGSNITFDLSKSISINLIPKIPLRDPQQFHQSLHTSPLPQKGTNFAQTITNSKTAQKYQPKQKQKEKARSKRYIRVGY